MARRFARSALLIAVGVGFVGCAATWEQGAGYHTEYADDASSYDEDFDRYGRWVDVDPYGRAWCPEVSSAWSPYTIGYWASTDDGWYWVAEDPWGWVPYHYGRWTYDAFYGWVWVPGDVWAPAWVAWRYGSGWVGWAPLPPDVSWNAHIGIDVSDYDLDRHIDDRTWSFVGAQDFGTQRVRVRVERPDRNGKLLKETRNVTHYVAGPRPVETGMRPDLIREIREKKIERFRIVDSSKLTKSGLTVRGRKAEVFRPNEEIQRVVGERVRALPQQKRPETTSRAIERGSGREDNEVRVAERDGVPAERPVAVKSPEPRESARDQSLRNEAEVGPPQVKQAEERPPQMKEAEEPHQRVEAQRGQSEKTKREEIARERQERAGERHERAPGRVEKDARQREQVAPKRQEDARQGEEVRNRGEEPQERGTDAGNGETVSPDREIRESGDREPKGDAGGRKREDRPRSSKDDSKGRTRER
jgi:hypothetical protein